MELVKEECPSIITLRNYKSTVQLIELLQEQVNRLSNFVHGESYDGMPFNPSVYNSVEKQHVHLIEAKRKLEERLVNQQKELNDCLNVLSNVQNDKSRYILTELFIHNKTLQQVQIDAPFDLCYRQLIRLKNKGLQYIREAYYEVKN